MNLVNNIFLFGKNFVNVKINAIIYVGINNIGGCVEIKSVNIRTVNSENGLKAFASVNFEDVFVVHGIRLVEGKEGLFLSFPAVIRSENKYFDIAHPISSDFRKVLTDAVIKAYEEEVSQAEEN